MIRDTLIGTLWLLVGTLMLLPLVPGPGLLVFQAGLSRLAPYYSLARHVLTWTEEVRSRFVKAPVLVLKPPKHRPRIVTKNGKIRVKNGR